MAVSAYGVAALKTLFIVLTFMMFALAFWAIDLDGLASCSDFRRKWLIVLWINFYTNLGVILAWMVYKESSWIKAAILIPSVLFAGSIITSAYIAIQLFMLSVEESSKDPLFFVLVRHQKGLRDAVGYTRRPSVLIAKVILCALGFLMLGTFIYVLIVDGSPFRAGVFSKCMIATLVDIYFLAVTLSVWVVYKESSWISCLFWILALLCFGSAATCAYIVRELFYLSSQQSVSDILVKNKNIDLSSSDPMLMPHTDV